MQSPYGFQDIRTRHQSASAPGKHMATAVFLLAFVTILALLAAPRGYVVSEPGPDSGGVALQVAAPSSAP